MARIIRLVWRLDFEFSWQYLDNMGSMLKTLNETIPKFWNELHDGQVVRTYGATRTSDDLRCEMTIEPQSFNGTIAWPLGTELERALASETFSGLDKILRELLRLAEVSKMNRAGIRFIGVDKRHSKVPAKGQPLDTYVPAKLLDALSKEFGPVNDVAAVIQGQTKDELNYKAQFGPLADDNIRANIPAISKDDLRSYDEYEIFFDIDVYENNISFREHSLARWGKTKVESATVFLNIIKDMEKEEGRGRTK